jgi:hypothetical protein
MRFVEIIIGGTMRQVNPPHYRPEPHCREPMRSAAGKRTDFLEDDPQTSSGAPNHTATLPGAAEHQLKSIWQLGLPRYFEACSAGGIVYNSAINDRGFRVNDQFGHGISRRGPNTCEPSRIHRRPSKTTRPTVNFAEYFECFVERYSYRNIPAAARKPEISCIGSYLSRIRHQANCGWVPFCTPGLNHRSSRVRYVLLTNGAKRNFEKCRIERRRVSWPAQFISGALGRVNPPNYSAEPHWRAVWTIQSR